MMRQFLFILLTASFLSLPSAGAKEGSFKPLDSGAPIAGSSVIPQSDANNACVRHSIERNMSKLRSQSNALRNSFNSGDCENNVQRISCNTNKVYMDIIDLAITIAEQFTGMMDLTSGKYTYKWVAGSKRVVELTFFTDEGYKINTPVISGENFFDTTCFTDIPTDTWPIGETKTLYYANSRPTWYPKH